jgi:DNA repair protein RadC
MPSYQITPVFSTKLVREGSIKTQPFSNSSDRAKAVCIEYLKDSPCERFVIVMLSTQLQVIGFAEITVGTLDASLVHPREVFRPAILANASAIIIAHNHPSTHLTPSREDKAVFDRLQTAGELLGIRVMDSIICNDETAISMRE